MSLLINKVICLQVFALNYVKNYLKYLNMRGDFLLVFDFLCFFLPHIDRKMFYGKAEMGMKLQGVPGLKEFTRFSKFEGVLLGFCEYLCPS